MKNRSANKLLCLSNTFMSLSWGSDRLILNIDPTSVWDGLIFSLPSFALIATNLDEKYIRDK